MQRDDWTAAASPYQQLDARLADADQLDEGIAQWTRSQHYIELMDRLQAVGVAAGAVLNGEDLLNDPHLAARGTFIPQDRPGLGVKHYPTQPYRFASAGSLDPQRSPLLGEHTREVLSRILGLDQTELDELERDDVIGTVPIAARPD